MQVAVQMEMGRATPNWDKHGDGDASDSARRQTRRDRTGEAQTQRGCGCEAVASCVLWSSILSNLVEQS